MYKKKKKNTALEHFLPISCLYVFISLYILTSNKIFYVYMFFFVLDNHVPIERISKHLSV